MNKKICRLCLSKPSKCYSLLEDNLPEMVEAILAKRLEDKETEFTICCLKCLLNLKLAYKIKQDFLKAESKLKEINLLNNVEIKEEIEIEMNDLSTEIKIENQDEIKESNKLVNVCWTECVICGLTTESNQLDQHIQNHFNETQTCDSCKKSFKNLNEYKIHITETNCSVNPTECEKCGVTFRYKTLYNLHIQKFHQDDNQIESKTKELNKLSQLASEKLKPTYICEFCSKEFRIKKKFFAHRETHKKKMCSVCNVLISRPNFMHHMLIHSSQPQICEICGAVLKTVDSLRGHMLRHRNISFKCEECGKIFKEKYKFSKHKKTHSGNKDHICDCCGKAFYSFVALNRHMKTAHLKLRPHICEYCQKGFSSRFALKTHIRQHTNENPYKCEICGEGFRQNVSLKGHRKSKHNIIEEKNCACPVCGKLFSSQQAILSHMRLH